MGNSVSVSEIFQKPFDTLTYEEARLPETTFSNVTVSSRHGGPKLMFTRMCKAFKQNISRSKLK